MNMLSRNVELRFISRDPAANGETDFKGETSTLNTQQRIEYLNRYAEVLPQYVDHFSLDEPIVTLEEAKERLARIKPQPLPQVRRRMVLDDWRWTGNTSEKEKEPLHHDAGHAAVARQDWRCFVEWVIGENARDAVFALGSGCVAGLDATGSLSRPSASRRISSPGNGTCWLTALWLWIVTPFPIPTVKARTAFPFPAAPGRSGAWGIIPVPIPTSRS